MHAESPRVGDNSCASDGGRPEQVLAEKAPYDSLTEKDQSIIRARWEDRISVRLAELNLEEKFRASGRSWTESDSEGNPVKRDSHWNGHGIDREDRR